MTTITNAPPTIDRTPPGNPAGRQAVKDLATSLKSGDLDGARQAYVQVVKNAPEGATWNPESHFAEIGRALKAGNLEAAKEAAKAAWDERRPSAPPVTPGVPEPVLAPSTTGGTAGTLLNVVA
jgi:hypothetical protein